MRFQVASSPTTVGLYDFWTIKADSLERINSDEDDAGVRVDAMLSVAVTDCMQNWGDGL